jgi:hypothetical protein
MCPIGKPLMSFRNLVPSLPAGVFAFPVLERSSLKAAAWTTESCLKTGPATLHARRFPQEILIARMGEDMVEILGNMPEDVAHRIKVPLNW